MVPRQPPPNFLAPQPASKVLNNPFMFFYFLEINLRLIMRNTFHLGRSQNQNPLTLRP